MKRNHQLPRRFQIQEYVSGVPYGISAGFDDKGRFKVFEIHQQYISKEGKFTGGRWTPAIEDKALVICQKLSEIEELSLLGLICMDIINGEVIEINPRLTASAPVSHILRYEDQIANHLLANFKIRQIDIHTAIQIPYESVKTDTLFQLIKMIWKEFEVLVLPQGLNPFGNSRFLFINDNNEASAQRAFINRIK